jgi:hypothetical protein
VVAALGADDGDIACAGAGAGAKQDVPLHTPHGPVELQQDVHFGNTGGTICVFKMYLLSKIS